MIVSVIIAAIQFLGFPSAWDKFFTFVAGIVILGIAYRMMPKVKTPDARSLPYMDYKRGETATITNPNTEQTQ